MVKIYLKGEKKEYVNVLFWSIFKAYFLAGITWLLIFWGLTFLFLILTP